MIFGVCATFIAFHYLIIKYRKRLTIKKETKRYYKNMEKFGLKKWQIYQSYREIISYKELKQLNRKLEAAVKEYNL